MFPDQTDEIFKRITEFRSDLIIKHFLGRLNFCKLFYCMAFSCFERVNHFSRWNGIFDVFVSWGSYVKFSARQSGKSSYTRTIWISRGIGTYLITNMCVPWSLDGQSLGLTVWSFGIRGSKRCTLENRHFASRGDGGGVGGSPLNGLTLIAAGTPVIFPLGPVLVDDVCNPWNRLTRTAQVDSTVYLIFDIQIEILLILN